MAKALILDDDRLFPADRQRAGDRAGALRQRPRARRSSARMATAIRAGSRSTSRSPTPPTCCWPPTTTSTACSTAKAWRWRSCGSRAAPACASGDPRAAWRRFAEHFHLFRGTPSALWLDHVFAEVFGLRGEARGGDGRSLLRRHRRGAGDRCVSAAPACSIGSTSRCWPPRKVAVDTLEHHAAIGASGWGGRVITAYRPDAVIDAGARRLSPRPAPVRRADRQGRDAAGAATWRRTDSAGRPSSRAGATSTDHGHPSAATADLTPTEAERAVRDHRRRHAPARTRPSCSAPRC